MFPEKIIIDTISDYVVSNPQTTKSDVSFDDVKYEMTIFDYMTRNVLLHVPTNTILHFGFHPSFQPSESGGKTLLQIINKRDRINMIIRIKLRENDAFL